MRAIRRGLDLAALALAGAVVAAVLTGGTGFELGPFEISLHSARNPALLLLAVLGVRLASSGRLRAARGRRRFRLPEVLLWGAGSCAYVLYSLHLGLPLFWGGYFVAVLLVWAALILARAAGIGIEFSPPWRRPLLWLSAAAAVFYFAAYAREPHAPRSAADRGIWTRYDQGCYYRMAREIAAGGLAPSSYRYGLGYPVLAVPFLRLAPVNPFFPADLLLYLLAVGAVFQAGTALLGRPGALLAVFLSLGPPFVEFFLIPWSSAVSTAVLAVFLALGVSRRRGRGGGVGAAVGLGLGWVFAARYVDAVLFLPCAGAALRGRGGRAWTVAAVVAAAIGGGVAASHQTCFGSPFRTPYYSRAGIGDQTLRAYRPADIPRHFYEVFVDPFSGTGFAPNPERYPALARSFILVLFPWGVVRLVRRSSPERGAWVCFLVSLGAGWAFYASFFASDAGSLVYGNLRYFLPWIPGAVIIAVYAAERIRRRRPEE